MGTEHDDVMYVCHPLSLSEYTAQCSTTAVATGIQQHGTSEQFTSVQDEHASVRRDRHELPSREIYDRRVHRSSRSKVIEAEL